MKIMLTGASGFIGQRLIPQLAAEGDSLHAIGRRRPAGPVAGFSEWDVERTEPPMDALEGSSAIVHLAGEPVGQKWSPEIKSRIRDSRVKGTRNLVSAIGRMDNRPQTLICASAIGYYGDRGEETLDESSTAGEGFLSEVCIEWEKQALEATQLGLRVVLLRTGIVIGHGGGVLDQMLTPFKLGVGGPTATGKQWMSWIHLDDLVSAIKFSIQNTGLSGPINGVGPNPVRNQEFTQTLGKVLNRPAVIPTPVFALKLLLGEAAVIGLASLKVLPQALRRAGFQFHYTTLENALQEAVQSSANS